MTLFRRNSSASSSFNFWVQVFQFGAGLVHLKPKILGQTMH